jgi:arabinogalactan endo-1,4-beta-galactosidase
LRPRGRGVLDYDFIGVSYYPKWSADMKQASADRRQKRFKADIIVVEVSYP